MHRSAVFLDHQTVIDEIFHAIINNDQKFILLEGNSGAGKSFLSGQVGDRWIISGQRNVFLYAEGDEFYVDRPFYPLTESLSLLKDKFDRAAFFKKGVSELSKGIPFAGDLVSYLIDVWAGNKDNNKSDSLSYLSSQERVILDALDSYFAQSDILFIFDNFHWWDERAINFVKIMTSGKLSKSFPFLDRAKFVFVITSNQRSPNNKLITELLTHLAPVPFMLELISEADFLPSLRLFGFKGVMDDVTVHLLFSFTGGHLTLMKNLSLYLAEPAFYDRYVNTDWENFSESGHRALLNEVLTIRLKALGARGEQIINILEYASVIGLSFSFEELACISKEKEATLKDIIETAKANYLLDDNELKATFAHDVIREFFIDRLQSKKSGYLSNFAHCLNILRPSDYLTRAKFLLESGNTEEALIVYVIAHLKNLRDGISTSLTIINLINQYAGQYGILECFISLNAAYEAFFADNYSLTIDILEAIEQSIDKRLVVEKDYLLALSFSRSKELGDIHRAIQCLSGWEVLKNEESEIWTRIVSTLMVMHIHLYDFDTAKKLEKQLMIFLSERLKFDSSSNVNLNILRRKSGALHICEIAVSRTAKSVDFFSRQLIGHKLIYPIEFFKSLANHAGNLIVLGRYGEAFQYSAQAVELIKMYPEIVFPSVFTPGNNYILSGFLLETVTSAQALAMYEEILPDRSNLADHLLMSCNMAIMYIYNNQIDAAEQLFDELCIILAQKTDIDAYYEYFIRSNAFCLQFLLNKTMQEGWTKLSEQIPNIPEKPYLIKRHNLLDKLFKESTTLDIKVWLSILKGTYPSQIGPSWEFYGNLFLFTDLQYWSES